MVSCKEILKVVWDRRFRLYYLLPRARSGEIGSLCSLPIRSVMPDRDYRIRVEILQLYDRKSKKDFKACYRDSQYYRWKCGSYGPKVAERCVRKYLRLLRSIRKDGYKEPTGVGNHPCMVKVGSEFTRADGAHRLCILRYLKKKNARVVLVSEDEVRVLYRKYPNV